MTPVQRHATFKAGDVTDLSILPEGYLEGVRARFEVLTVLTLREADRDNNLEVAPGPVPDQGPDPATFDAVFTSMDADAIKMQVQVPVANAI
jgi:hypothetical protein